MAPVPKFENPTSYSPKKITNPLLPNRKSPQKSPLKNQNNIAIYKKNLQA